MVGGFVLGRLLRQLFATVGMRNGEHGGRRGDGGTGTQVKVPGRGRKCTRS